MTGPSNTPQAPSKKVLGALGVEMLMQHAFVANARY